MIYLFDKDEKLVKIVKNTAIKTALQKFALTNEHYISDRLDIDMKAISDTDLAKIEYVAIQSMEDSHTFHYFWIAQKQNKANLTTIVSVQSGIEELQKTTVKDIRPKNKEARPVIDELLLGTNWTARFVEGVDVASATFYYISTFEALKKVCEIWGLEMQFFVEMNGNKVGGRYIDFKKKIGVRSGKRVVYGHNALEILQEIERTNIYTALIGRGKGEQVSADGYGRKITFADVVWDSPVAKPKGQEYVELPSMTALYGIKNADGTMRPKIGFVEFQEETDPATLLKRTYNHLVNVARPQAAFKTSAVYLKGVKIGDTVRVVRHDKKIDYETRIFEITFNRLNNKASDIKLGDNIRGTDSQNQAIQTSISNAIESTITSFVTKLPDFLPSADGFNSNWYTDSDPTLLYPGKVLINDLWFKPDSEFPGEYVMLRWTGEAWEEVIRTADSVKFEDALAEVNAAIKDGDDALNKKYDEIVAKTISQDTLISQAQSTADSAKTDATTALSNIASESQKLTEQINTLSKTEGDHYTATNQTLAQLDGTVKGLQTDYTALVNKDNEITQTLTNYKQTIDQNTASITENKQTVDGTLSSLQTQVTQNKNDIATKASQLIVNNLSGRMSSAETTITQNANEISTRLSQTNIESLITSKATVITDNKVKETSDSFSREITRVEGLVGGIFSGNNNLLLDTKSLASNVNIKNNTSETYLGGTVATAKAPSGSYQDTFMQAMKITPEGNEFIVSFYAKSSVDNVNIRNYFYSPNRTIKGISSTGALFSKVNGGDGSISFNLTTQWERYWIKWTIRDANSEAENVPMNVILGRNFDSVNSVSIALPALYAGNTTIDYSEAPEDLKAVTDGLTIKYNTVKDTVDSHTQQIGQQGSSLTTTIQRVDSIQSSVSNIDGRLSTVTQTADGLVTTVQNLSVGGRNYLTKSNLIKDSGTNKLNALSIYDAETPNGFKVTGNDTKNGTVRLYNVINSDGWWTVSFDVKGSQSLAVDVTVDVCDQGITKIWTNATNTYERKSISVNVTNYSKNPSTYHFVDFSNFAFAYFWIDNIKIEKGNMPTDYSPAPEDTDAKISSIQTTVTQTANSWAVKNLTSNGSILSQINLTDGTVKIDGKYVKITGQTLIDNGIITNAMIKDLTADKIIGGTIDANKISVINLNASNITSGQISGGLIKGGVLTALNGAMSIDLNNGQINTSQDTSSIRRTSSDSASQFIRFEDGGLNTVPGGGIKAAHTIVGSNYRGNESTSDGFAGLEIYSGHYENFSRLIGDRIEFRANQSGKSINTGNWVFDFRNQADSFFYPQKGDTNHKNMFLGHPSSRITNVFSLDYNISDNGVSVVEYLKSLGLCMRHLLNGGFSDNALSAIRTERDKTLYKLGGGI
ncbi:phage tail spike protein [Streptococcus uberis]|uniref:phage tail spike protein n=1 Tax=Streptococcus uberis TaxID=1349 RepID=UPI000DFD8AA9|nr:phage tail spike protein [Streptococcus uberis]SUO92591.1 phage minor structural protein [Streptococcus uberis]